MLPPVTIRRSFGSTARFIPEVSGSPTFRYAFQWVVAAEPGFPTVILLPGGPGECAIQKGVPGDLPKGFGLIRTDPRGLGCNFTGELIPRDSISTRNLALDVLGIVNHLWLKHYYLYGVSYGTELATVAAGLAEAGAASKPDAVILEGVLGRAFRPNEVFDGFVERWTQIRAEVAPSVREKLDSLSANHGLLGLPAEEWPSAIANLMLIGAGPQLGDLAKFYLAKLSDDATEKDRTELRSTIHAFGSQNGNPKPQAQALYREIACRELASEVFASTQDLAFVFDRGRLLPVRGELCAGIPLDRPYDSAEWPTSAPIYYFEGAHDPSTPLKQALYHFETQTRSRRTFVTVPEGGHIDFLYGLKDCSGAIWSAIAANDGSLEAALSTCKLRTELRSTELR